MDTDQQNQLVKLITDSLKPEFNRIDKRLDKIETKLEEHDKRFEAIDKRFDKIELKLKEHDDRFDIMMQLLGEVDEKVDRNYQEMQGKIDNIYNVLDSTNKAVDRLETEFTFFSQHIDALEAAVRVLARHQNITVKLYGD